MTYQADGPPSEPTPSAAIVQARATRSSPGSVIVAIVSGLVAVALTAAATVLVINLGQPIEDSTEQEAGAEPGEVSATGNDFFTKVWLTDRQIDRLGLEPMDGSVRSVTLEHVIGLIDDGWRTGKGQPEECRFAGWYPGNSVYPVTGSEDDSDPDWISTVVSGTQVIGYDDVPYINITARIFEDEAKATEYLAGWDHAVGGCAQYTTEYNDYVTTAYLEPLHFDELAADNSGWLSSVPELNTTPDADQPDITSAEFYVLDVRHENVVVRVTMFSFTEADNADDFLQLASAASDNLARALQ